MTRKPTIMPVRMTVLCAAAAALLYFVSSGSAGVTPLHPPVPFVLEKAARHDVLLLGTTHRSPQILTFLADLVPQSIDAGITHVGLEIGSDQQANIDRFIETGDSLSSVHIFPGIDCPPYRKLLEELRSTPLKPVALDLPKTLWNRGYTRDQWMAERIRDTFNLQPGAKFLVVVGNFHVLKQVQWENPDISDRFIPWHLSEHLPELKIYSIAECVESSDISCNVPKSVLKHSKPVGFETKAMDRPIWLTRYLAAKPLSARLAVDAVIVH